MSDTIHTVTNDTTAQDLLRERFAKPLTTQEIAQRIYNGHGGRWMKRGRDQRGNIAVVSYKGVELECEYTIDGAFCPATADDPGCMPCAVLRSVKVGGVELLPLLEEHVGAIEEKIERQWVQA